MTSILQSVHDIHPSIPPPLISSNSTHHPFPGLLYPYPNHYPSQRRSALRLPRLSVCPLPPAVIFQLLGAHPSSYLYSFGFTAIALVVYIVVLDNCIPRVSAKTLRPLRLAKFTASSPISGLARSAQITQPSFLSNFSLR